MTSALPPSLPSEAERLKMLRLDQQLTVRETPAHEVERRIAEYRRKMRSL